MTDSPFIAGARVAIGERYGNGVTEGFVEKVRKNGNFTLRGSNQQWKPWHTYSRWSAVETGTGWHRRRLDLWDAETDKEITEKLEAHRATLRWHIIRSKVDAVKNPTLSLCEALEAALAQPSPQATETPHE